MSFDYDRFEWALYEPDPDGYESADDYEETASILNTIGDDALERATLELSRGVNVELAVLRAYLWACDQFDKYANHGAADTEPKAVLWGTLYNLIQFADAYDNA